MTTATGEEPSGVATASARSQTQPAGQASGATQTPAPPVPAAGRPALSVRQRNRMRVGYALMGFGLAAVEWPRVLDARTLPLFEGVVLCLLTAMSLLALLGLKHPGRLLPVLLLECLWKVLWLSTVAAPALLSGTVDDRMAQTMFSCALVVVVVAVIPWSYAWRLYAGAPTEPWRA